MPDCKSETSETSWLDNLHYPKAERYKDRRKAIAFLRSIKIPLRESPPTEPCPQKTFFPWLDKGVHYGIPILKDIGFLKGDQMVRWQMGDVDELQNLEAKINLSILKKHVQN